MDRIPHVLLIDDNDADNEYHELVIKKTGVDVRLEDFTDSRKAYAYLKNGCENGNPEDNPLPEIIFLDINMPAINGFELLDKLRGIPDPYHHKKKMNFFILTTSLNPYDR